MIYRFSIFITGERYIPITSSELQKYSLHISSDWKKDDSYLRRGKCQIYGYGGSHILHDSIFAENKEERAKILGDYIRFLEDKSKTLIERGANEIELAATVYLEKSNHFLLLTRKEMEQLLHCSNISVRLDILCLNEKEYLSIKKEMIRERSIVT